MSKRITVHTYGVHSTLLSEFEYLNTFLNTFLNTLNTFLITIIDNVHFYDKIMYNNITEHKKEDNYHEHLTQYT